MHALEQRQGAFLAAPRTGPGLSPPLASLIQGTVTSYRRLQISSTVYQSTRQQANATKRPRHQQALPGTD